MSKNGKILLKKCKFIQIFKNKDREKMCKKLEEISGIQPERLLEISGQSGAFPVDVAQICYDLGIRLMSFDFAPIENQMTNEIENKGNILGAVVVDNDDLAILYRQNDATNRKRFTIAHELAHSCLHMQPDEQNHIEFRIDKDSDNQKELEANIFAGKLLIPEKILNRLINNNKFILEKDLYHLSELFMVSENVMKARLNYLNIKILS